MQPDMARRLEALWKTYGELRTLQETDDVLKRETQGTLNKQTECLAILCNILGDMSSDEPLRSMKSPGDAGLAALAQIEKEGKLEDFLKLESQLLAKAGMKLDDINFFLGVTRQVAINKEKVTDWRENVKNLVEAVCRAAQGTVERGESRRLLRRAIIFVGGATIWTVNTAVTAATPFLHLFVLGSTSVGTIMMTIAVENNVDHFFGGPH